MNSGFFRTCDTFQEVHSFFTSSQGHAFRVAHVNIRSIRKYWDHFFSLTSPFHGFFDALVLTEINIPSDCIAGYSIPGYQTFSFTRPRGKEGGVAVFVRDIWSVSELGFCFHQAEAVVLRLSTPELSLVLLSVYRPPCFNGRLFLAELDSVLTSLSYEDLVCMIGDININTLRPTLAVVGDYLDVLSKWGLQNTIREPTREEFLSGQLTVSCIDHVNIRALNLATQSAIVEKKLADHYFVCCSIMKQSDLPASATDKREVSIVDPRIFDKLVAQHDWNTFLLTVSPADSYEQLVTQLNRFRQAATRIVKIKQRNLNHKWMSSEILAAIKEKDLLWSQLKRSPRCTELQLKYKMCRNRANAMIRRAKRFYLRSKFNEARTDPKKTWSLINDVRGTNTKATSHSNYRSLLSSGGQSIANDFNHLFSKVSGTARQHTNSCTLRNSVLESAYLPFLDEDELKTVLFSLKSNKSPGIDGISINELRRSFEVLKTVLLSILNGIIYSGVIPLKLKTAIVIPLFKAGARNNIENYRPISILPCIAQLLEKHLCLVMTRFLDKHRIMSPSQYGFVQGRGTQMLLEDFSDLLNSSFERNQVACALFLDVSKAFDSVCHRLLLNKLSMVGFRGSFLLLLQNFLQDRRQCVSIEQFRSNFSIIKAGVPQGSVLSPLLFNIYVNDLSSTVPTSIFQYADDTVIVACASKYLHAISLLQNAANRAMDWFDANLISINTTKTQLICFHSPLKRVSLTSPLFLHTSNCLNCACTPVNYTSTVKYLGLIFDSDLAWNSQLAHICKKLRAVSCLMYSVRYVMPLSVRKVIIHALGYSVLRYGITVYGHCALRWKIRINSILRSLLKVISYDLSLDKDTDVFRALCFPDFDSLLIETVVFRHFWNSSFKVPYAPARCLRPKKRYCIPRCSTRYGERMRRYYVPSYFNKLPMSIFCASTKYKLKKALRNRIV